MSWGAAMFFAKRTTSGLGSTGDSPTVAATTKERVGRRDRGNSKREINQCRASVMRTVRVLAALQELSIHSLRLLPDC